MHPLNFYRFGVCLFVFYYCEVAFGQDDAYIGCYRDQQPNRLMSNAQGTFEDLTPASCIDKCRKDGYIFAGVQAGTTCFCSNYRPPLLAKFADDADCESPCGGNSNAKCGGDWKLSVYKTGLSDLGAIPTGYYLGCYTANENIKQTDPKNIIPKSDFDINFRLSSEYTQPVECFESCFRKGYRLAGVYRHECYCINKEPDQKRKTDESECDLSCYDADTNKKCGGASRFGVYSTGLTDVTEVDKRVGCYDNTPESEGESGPALRRFKTDLPETNSPLVCMNMCYQMGFKLAGVQNGSECMCGNKRPDEKKAEPPNKCTQECAGDRTWRCGGKNHIRVYRTPVPGSIDEEEEKEELPTVPPPDGSPEVTAKPVDNPPLTDYNSDCPTSITLHNGKPACNNTVIFFDNFSHFDSKKWKPEIKFAAAPDYEFAVYDGIYANIHSKDGALHIRPTVIDESIVENGKEVFAKIDCTGDSSIGECTKNPEQLILPPVHSARITTKEKFNFKYGVVDIQAKLPVGDWILSEIWLVPANNAYGPSYQSGKIRIMSRGNVNLKYKDNTEMGCQVVEGSVMVGVGEKIKKKSIFNSAQAGCHEEFRKFTIVWTPDDISFFIDNEKQSIMEDAKGKRLGELFDDLSKAETKVWREGSVIAPFDKQFYISIGVSAGGIRDFEDGSESAGHAKPWNNTDSRAMLKFWQDKETWKSTWRTESSLEIKSIKVTSL